MSRRRNRHHKGMESEPPLLPEGEPEPTEGLEVLALANIAVSEAIINSATDHLKCGCNSCKGRAEEDFEWLIPGLSCEGIADLISMAGSRARKQMVAANFKRQNDKNSKKT